MSTGWPPRLATMTPSTQISTPITTIANASSNIGQAMAREKNALGLHQAAVVRFQALEYSAERAGLFADVGHFAKKWRKHVAGASQCRGQAVAVGDGVADLREIWLQPAAGRFRLALPRAADVDAGVRLDRQTVAELGERFVRELGLQHGCQVLVVSVVVGGESH